MSHPTSIVNVRPLGFPWETIDPFLFCAYHDDKYPKGNADFGPAASLAGRQMGSDFAGIDGWRMYHGETVPGFPSHPHRGFETVTIVRRGLIDHSDSLGAAARFGGGDVQWLTAGKGIVHSEMFPLLDSDKENPLELFQIWLNLPARSKMADPHFTMFWSGDIPHREFKDDAGQVTEVAVIAGHLQGGAHVAGHEAPLAPPPDSWASQADADVAIWTVKMAPGARWTLPAASSDDIRRSLYFFKGASVSIDGGVLDQHAAVELRGSATVTLHNGPQESEFLVLQGRPIAEKVAQYGPFVMNSEQELRQAFADYQRTQFGGWPWERSDPVHGAEKRRFAKHADGRTESREAHPAEPSESPLRPAHVD